MGILVLLGNVILVMAEFFKSALGILGGGQARDGNEFVGQTVELGNQKLRVRRLIAEGKKTAVAFNGLP